MMRKMMYRLLLPASVAISACQYTPRGVAPETRLGPLVGSDELAQTGRPLLLDALRVARPNYFNSRGPTTLLEQGLQPMVVVLDGHVLDIETLRVTPVKDVVQVRRLSPSETYFRYNKSVSVGALEIVTRKR
jgi:hypothetical protein